MKVRRQHRFKRRFASLAAMQLIEQIAHAAVANSPEIARKLQRMSNRRVGVLVKGCASATARIGPGFRRFSTFKVVAAASKVKVLCAHLVLDRGFRYK